jgi:hypothetical protein
LPQAYRHTTGRERRLRRPPVQQSLASRTVREHKIPFSPREVKVLAELGSERQSALEVGLVLRGGLNREHRALDVTDRFPEGDRVVEGDPVVQGPAVRHPGQPSPLRLDAGRCRALQHGFDVPLRIRCGQQHVLLTWNEAVDAGEAVQVTVLPQQYEGGGRAAYDDPSPAS